VGPLTVLGTNTAPAAPFIAGIAAGFAIGAFGHIVKSTTIIVLGILVIGVTTALFIIVTDPTLGSG
jgi:hypothetical protein